MDIKLENLTKIYDYQKAVDNISFEVKTGEILGFLGPNGAGKTTTMKAITCYLSPDSGDIKVGGLSVLQNPSAVKKNIGYLPENNPLYADMAVIDYLKFAAELQNVPKEKIKDRLWEMIQVCGLKNEKHKKIRELSKGYKQRVGLAQAMIHDPKILILDEPTTGLDPNQIVEIRELIRRIGREKTVILSSHILAEVEATCDRIIIINKGRIVADGTSEELRKQAQGDEILKIQIKEGEVNEIFRALQNIESVALVDLINSEQQLFEVQSLKGMKSAKNIFSLCASRGWYIGQLTPVETKLEDVFREVTTN
ncbi:MAG TPA: ATP-binding cassette domain-containing protein [Prolixibacteraceae bacterium]|nr:ATP-binding cassette domain-containing protein [Prolixibacteraceae bacterium]HUM88437.1 ATP-binding cassette domain-containing protein [Prolixibacteraceae bacterium]